MSAYHEMLLRERCAIENTSPFELVESLTAQLAAAKAELAGARKHLEEAEGLSVNYRGLQQERDELRTKLEAESSRLDWLGSLLLNDGVICADNFASGPKFFLSDSNEIKHEKWRVVDKPTIREAIDAAMSTEAA